MLTANTMRLGAGHARLRRWFAGLRQPRASSYTERAIEMALLTSALISVLTTLGIVAVLAGEALAFFRTIGLAAFLTDSEWTPLFAEQHFGIWPLMAGTVLTTAVAIAVALPFGLLAAIYLSELATARARRLLKPALEVLAGVPTIAYGYFALVLVTPALQKVVGGLAGFNALSPGIAMGIMITPMIASLSEDALCAVPRRLREGALALGVGRVATTLGVVLPAASPGIAASVVLAVARAMGETIVVTLAAGQQPRLTLDPRVPIETMTAYIAQISMGDVPTGTLAYQTIFAVGASLFVMTLAASLVSQRLMRRFRRVV